MTSFTRKASKILDWDVNNDEALEKLKTKIHQSAPFIALDWGKKDRGPVDAFKYGMVETLIQPCDNEQKAVTSIFTEDLFLARQNYTANDR